MDGVGEWATTSTWIGKGKQINSLWEISFPHSLGLLYSAFTYYCGFKVNSGEYKLMGLAPYGEPKYVIRSPDHRKFGLSPIPDKVYNVHFYAYSAPTELSAHGDTIVFPDQYASVIIARTRYYVHQFKENLQQAAFALDDYKKGMKRMKSNLINPQPKSMTDDRIAF